MTLGELASQTIDIALQVGFSSQNHLTQQFKCLTGMTSKQVR
ncbi:AraC family transcriptional regulator [Trichocoleus sp. FACHB-90]